MMRALIAVVALFVVVAVIVVVRGGGEDVKPPVTPVSTGPVDTGGTTPQDPVVVRTETHVIDCGAPAYMEGKYVDKQGNTFVALELKTVSEGQTINYLQSPKWLKTCDLKDVDKENNSTAGKLPGLAIYNFEVQRDDTFFVFVSAKWTDTCGNSVWVLMNGPETGGHGPEGNKYYKLEDQLGFVTEKNYNLAWHPLIAAGEPVKFALKKGMNRIELHTREDGPRFDQIVISTSANPPATLRVKGKS